MDNTSRGWSLLVVPIRAYWWWERGIESGWVIKRTLRGRESVRGIEVRERERVNVKYFTEISIVKYITQICLD